MYANTIETADIVAISNPRSGRNKRGGFELFTKVLEQYPTIEHIVTNHENNLLDALDACKQHKIKIIIVNGGDGTLLQVLTYLKIKMHHAYQPSLVLLKAGTTSMAFGDVGCKGKLKQVIDKIINYVKGDKKVLKETFRPVLQMTLPEKDIDVCGMFFGAGAIYNGILYCRQNIHTKGLRGELGPSMAMIRYIFDWITVNKLTTSSYAVIQTDENSMIKGDFNIITATTLNRLLMGVFPFWGSGRSNNNISLTLIKKNAPKATKALTKILRGVDPCVEKHADFYHSFCPQKTILNIQDGFTLDGELFGEQGISTKVILQSAGDIKFLTI
ncbi:MAG: diacylglycerol kinase family protein [Gammaproteobacteria bacterium]|nr:diacylglycerol kinase family protein [Gammaproteobacteria bacterium]